MKWLRCGELLPRFVHVFAAVGRETCHWMVPRRADGEESEPLCAVVTVSFGKGLPNKVSATELLVTDPKVLETVLHDVISGIGRLDLMAHCSR